MAGHTTLQSTIVLNSGHSMPLFGLGVSRVTNVTHIVSTALKHGYRLIDTAERYDNEVETGEGIKLSGVPRNQLFIVTKTFEHGEDYCKNAIVRSLDKLGLQYVDLYLIHSPYDMAQWRNRREISPSTRIIETYDTLLSLKDQGFIRSVGVSNFGIQHLEGLRQAGRPAPAVNQIEVNPWTQKRDLVDYCREHDIQVMGYSPLCKAHKLDEPGLVQIAEKHKKTPTQIAIRWSVQKRFVTIPKTSQVSRLQENADVFDIDLSAEDMEVLGNTEFHESRLWPSDPTQLPWTG